MVALDGVVVLLVTAEVSGDFAYGRQKTKQPKKKDISELNHDYE